MSKPLEVTSETFGKEVLQAQIPVVVDFWAPWCGPCRMMAPVLEKIASSFEGKMKVAKLNTDEYPDLAGEYQITGIPCLIVFNGGKEVKRIVGYQQEQALTKELNSIL